MAASKKKLDAIKQTADSMKANAGTIVIEQPKFGSVTLEVEGTNGIIQNCFGQKAIEEMLRKHMGISTQREKKKPRELLEAAKIKNINGVICVPTAAFKKAMLTASTQIKGMKKTQLRIQLMPYGKAIPITYEEEIPRMDMVRLNGIGRPPDVRFRPMFEGWKARISIQFAEALSVQSVVDLLNRAGSVGVGEWRPERDGVFGTFRVVRHISSKAEIEEVHKECDVPLVAIKIPDWAMDMDIDPTLMQKLLNEGDDPAFNKGETESLTGQAALDAADAEELEDAG
jgi:hypothetical protein